MGLSAEEAKKGGYLGNMTIDKARDRARDITSFDPSRANARRGTSKFPSAAARARVPSGARSPPTRG